MWCPLSDFKSPKSNYFNHSVTRDTFYYCLPHRYRIPYENETKSWLSPQPQKRVSASGYEESKREHLITVPIPTHVFSKS